MTREEQIAVASCAYGVKGSSIDFTAGAKWADQNPKSPWISVEEDLPCNHKELIDRKIPLYTIYVLVVFKSGIADLSRMINASEGNWKWIGPVTHWFPIPKLPKE